MLVLAGAAAAGGGALTLSGPAMAADYPKGDIVQGNPDASIEIIEYASMTCPHCRAFHETIYPRLKADWIDTGKARFIFREFPLDRYALQASMLARCGGEARFHGFIDLLFQQQSNWARASDPTAALRQLGLMGGVSGEQFDACIGDESLVDMLLKTRLEGHEKMGVKGTPTVFINGEKVEDTGDYAAMNDLLQSLM